MIERYIHTYISKWQHNKVSVAILETTHLVHTGGIFKKDESEAAGSARAGVHLNGAVRDLAELWEVVLKVLFTGVPAQAAHKHFTADSVERYFNIPLVGGLVSVYLTLGFNRVSYDSKVNLQRTAIFSRQNTTWTKKVIYYYYRTFTHWHFKLTGGKANSLILEF